MNMSQKIENFKKQNVDFLIDQKFSKNFSSIKADSFIKNYLNKKIKTKFLFVSSNFKFGNNREGDINLLKFYEKNYNYKLIIPFPLKKYKKTISSTLIRKKISLGKIKEANKLLNRTWCVRGKVIKGKKRGRKIGFPTCNVKLKDYVVPKLGVYSVVVETDLFKKKV